MPIYAYRCTSCGHAQDVLQKISDPLLEVCPACGAATFAKQVTAAGFQLKGSGWYVTDFRGGNTAAKKEGDGAAADAAAKPDSGGAKPAPGGDAKPATGSDAKASGSDAKPAAGDAKPKGAEAKSASAPAGPPAATPST